MQSAITHLFAGVPVSDLDASIDWYTRFFGRPPDMRAGEEILWEVDEHVTLFIDFLVDDPRLEEELTGELMSVADIQEVFGVPADPELQGPDGIHPPPAGQKAITRAVVEGLTT